MLKIYGVPLSQPCRAVIWACLYKKLPFELILTNPGSKSVDRAGNVGSRHPDYLELVPSGTIPAIDDNGLTLWESNAILTYLAQKHAWSDLYPEDLASRSRIDQYLHWHHRNAREASLRLAAPCFRKDLTFPEGYVEQGMATVLNSLQIIDTGFLRDSDYIASPTLSLADFACYMEFGQLNAKFGNLVDFSPFPKVQSWMNKMEDVPFFEEANMANTIIGDLNDGVEKTTIGKANKESFAAIQAAVSKL